MILVTIIVVVGLFLAGVALARLDHDPEALRRLQRGENRAQVLHIWFQ